VALFATLKGVEYGSDQETLLIYLETQDFIQIAPL
jgi:hypothetical protein